MNDMVTVIIPTYGRAAYLVRAIESVIAQTYPDIQLIVVDDNDPDTAARKNTEAAVARYLPREGFVYLRHPANRNGAAARNTGLRHAQGRFIAFLDDDDEFLPEKIGRQVDFLGNNPQFDGCYCKANLVEKNRIYYRSTYGKQGNLALDTLTLKSECYTPALCIKKEALVRIGGFNENFRRHQDFELLLKYFQYYRLGHVDEYLLNVHIDNRDNQPDMEGLEALKSSFLKEFKGYIDSYDKATQEYIYQQHNFELLVYAVRRLDLPKVLKYLVKTRPDFRLLSDNANKMVKILRRLCN